MSFYEYCELLNLDRPNIASDLKVTTLLHKSQIERTQIMMQLSKVQKGSKSLYTVFTGRRVSGIGIS